MSSVSNTNMNCKWIGRKCCYFWPFNFNRNVKEDAKFHYNPDDHFKVESKRDEMKEVSNISDSSDDEFMEIELTSKTGLENENQDEDIIKEIKNHKELVNHTIKREMILNTNDDINFSELNIKPEELTYSRSENLQEVPEEEEDINQENISETRYVDNYRFTARAKILIS